MEIVLTQADIESLIKHYYKGVKSIAFKGKKVVLEVESNTQFIDPKPLNRQPPPPPQAQEIKPQPPAEQNVMGAGGERDRRVAFIG